MQRIVIKIGSSSLTEGSARLSRRAMLNFAQQIAALHQQKRQIVLISSGAVAAGKESLHRLAGENLLPTKQMFASVGQVLLMQTWADLFAIFGIQVGQILLTRSDFANRRRYLNIRDTLQSLLSHGLIPIINENDTVAMTENRVGNNDKLAALAANLIAADLLVLLTDQQGLYTANPQTDPQATLISHISKIDSQVYAYAGKGAGTLGTGGMLTKIEAAEVATQSGVPTIVASAQAPNVLQRLVSGEEIGTCFASQISLRESRKRWLLSESPQGVITIDQGAVERILKRGASLLPAGITQTSSSYERGALIQIRNPNNEIIAVGLSNYCSRDVAALRGLHTSKVADVLGYSYGNEVVHRDNLVLLQHAG